MKQEPKVLSLHNARIRRDLKAMKEGIKSRPRPRDGELNLLGDDPEKVCRELDGVAKRFMEKDDRTNDT